MPSYIPRRGDIVWLKFNPKAGHEQAGRRPALVMSPYEYNKKVGLFIVCPIISQMKGYSFEVRVSLNCGINGVVLADQIKSLDWKARQTEFMESGTKDLIDAVSARLLPLIDVTE